MQETTVSLWNPILRGILTQLSIHTQLHGCEGVGLLWMVSRSIIEKLI